MRFGAGRAQNAPELMAGSGDPYKCTVASDCLKPDFDGFWTPRGGQSARMVTILGVLALLMSTIDCERLRANGSLQTENLEDFEVSRKWHVKQA